VDQVRWERFCERNISEICVVQDMWFWLMPLSVLSINTCRVVLFTLSVGKTLLHSELIEQ